MTDLERQIAELIWTTSRADEGTISATGANIIAAALLPLIREREAAAWERALREAADKWQTGAWTALTEPIKAERQAQRIIGAAQVVLDWLRDRAAANPYAGSEGA